MSCSALIRADEKCFNLAQKLLTSLSEKYDVVNFDEAWEHVCNNTVAQLQKKFKKQKKASNPLSSIKKPRTSFSFFTKTQRAKIAEKNPNASFGELSKLVSKAWKSLSEKELKSFKSMETKDRKRYESEKEKLLATLATQEASAPVTSPVEEEPESPVVAKPAKKSKSSSKSTSTKGSTKTKASKSSANKKASSTSKSVGSYNAFQKAKRPEVKSANPKLGLKDVNTKLGQMWQSLTAEQKAVYV